jgi:hypothetical protein
MTLEEYEVVLAEKRAGLNQQREAAFKADSAQFSGMKTFAKEVEDLGLDLTKNVKVCTCAGGGSRWWCGCCWLECLGLDLTNNVYLGGCCWRGFLEGRGQGIV